MSLGLIWGMIRNKQSYNNLYFSSLSIVDKLTHMCDKLNFLEQANRTVVNIAQC